MAPIWTGGAVSGGGTGAGLSDWVKKTSAYTAANGDRILSDTTLGTFPITLPLAPSVGDQVNIRDYVGKCGTNNLTVGRNGQNIRGSAENLLLDYDYAEVELVFTGATEGWTF